MSDDTQVTEGVEATEEVAETEEVTLSQKLAGIDQFPVEWAGRDSHGNLELQGNVFKITVTPAGMFGQNIRDFGFDQAVELAEEESIEDHNFGACYVREKSLRKEADGRWYCDLSVDPHKVRYVKVTTMLVDDDGEAVLGDDGKPQIKTAPRKEAWITCELSQLEPMTDHPLSAVYRQSDRRTTAMLRANVRSENLGKSGAKKVGRGKGSRKRLSPEQIAAVLAQANA